MTPPTRSEAERIAAGLSEAQRAAICDRFTRGDYMRTLLALKRKGLMDHGPVAGPDAHYRLTHLGEAVRALLQETK